MNYRRMTFLVGFIVVTVITSGVVVSAIPALDKVINVNTGKVYDEDRYGTDFIQDAVNEANSGDIIVVYNGGAYRGKVDIKEQLTLEAENLSDKPVILGGYSEDFWESYGIAVHGSDPQNPEEGAPDNVVINGFRVRHDTPDSKGIWLIGSSGSTVKNNEIIDGWTEGIVLEEADNNTIKNNKVGFASLENGKETAVGNETGILLLNSHGNIIGPGNEVKYNGTGLEIVSSFDTTIEGSVFNENHFTGALLNSGYLYGSGDLGLNRNAELLPPDDIRYLNIRKSEFNENGVLAEPRLATSTVSGVDSIKPQSRFPNGGYGLLSLANIETMRVIGSEFNKNSSTGLWFSFPEVITPVVQETKINSESPPFWPSFFGVWDISIENSSFDDNGDVDDELSPGGFGLRSSVNMGKVSFSGSTFNSNSSVGMYLSSTTVYTDGTTYTILPHVQDISISGSKFNENGANAFTEGRKSTTTELNGLRPSSSYGLLTTAVIDGMKIEDSEFNENAGTGMAIDFPETIFQRPLIVQARDIEGASAPAFVRNVSIIDSNFNNNGYITTYDEPVGFGLSSSANTANMEISNSTFNKNYTSGLHFGKPLYRNYGPAPDSLSTSRTEDYFYPVNTITNLTVKNSEFNSNGVIEEPIFARETNSYKQTISPPPLGFGLLSTANIQGMAVSESEFNDNTGAGVYLASPEPEVKTRFEDISLTKSVFKRNVVGLYATANIEGLEISRSEFKGNSYGVFIAEDRYDSNSEVNSPEPSGVYVNHSRITDNDSNPLNSDLPVAGILNSTDTTINAAINWWGAANGPAVNQDYWQEDDSGLEYEGDGEKIIGKVAFAPWLRVNPDADPDTPGVQLINPLPIWVTEVGPVPTTKNGNTGFLDMAIWGASSVPVMGRVVVPHGTYKAEESLGNNAELISEYGTTCHTCLEEVEKSELTIEGNEVTIGKLDDFTPRGFIIKDEVKVQPGVDASTVHLNWNDVRNSVESNGIGRLDAEYNWWGDLDPSDSISGHIDYRPFLPENPCSFTEYMKEHNLENPREAVVNRMSQGETCSTDLPKRMIVKYHLRPREAEGIIDEHGCYDVRRALKNAGNNYSLFKNDLGITNI